MAARFTATWALLAVACSPAPDPEARDRGPNPPREARSGPKDAPATAADATACADAPGWRFERIELPPEFAPSLPRGVERLYFAPQMFEANTPGYWSYVFSLSFEADAAPADTAALEAMFDVYYTGLIAAVAAAKKLPPPTRANVSLTARGARRFTGRIETIDAFVTGDPIAVHLDVHAGERCLSVAASAAAPGAAIWKDLERARRCVPCGPP